MARRKKRIARPVSKYLESAKELSSLVPKLKKYSKRKNLSAREKNQISQFERLLRYRKETLVPVPTRAIKDKSVTRDKLFSKSVQAIDMRGLQTKAPGATIEFKKGTIYAKLSGRRWVFWKLSRAAARSKKEMRERGKQAFEAKFPVELAAELAREAFKKYHVNQVQLWTVTGLAGTGFVDLQAFIDWVNEKWSNGRYVDDKGYSSDPGQWINGIAIEIESEKPLKQSRGKKTNAKNKTRKA